MKNQFASLLVVTFLFFAASSSAAEIIVHTKDGKQIHVAVDPAQVASIEFVSGSQPVGSLAQQLAGSWSWTCCNGLHSGTFRIDPVRSDGTFTGRFGSGPDEGQSPIQGRISGDRVSFVRTILVNGAKAGEQSWTSRLVEKGGRWVLADGDWQGYARSPSNGGFSATRSP